MNSNSTFANSKEAMQSLLDKLQMAEDASAGIPGDANETSQGGDAEPPRVGDGYPANGGAVIHRGSVGTAAAGANEAAPQSSAKPTLWARLKRKMRRFAIAMMVLIILVQAAALTVILYGNQAIDESKLAAALPSSNSAASEAGVAGTVAAGSGLVHSTDMPDYVWQAFLAIEDNRFFEHPGIDGRAIARAAWADLKSTSFVQGGSTITMQLARNLFLTQDKTIQRKVNEMAIAINLEQRLTKRQILDLYLNSLYVGHGKYGIEAAANQYFGKTTLEKGADGKETISIGEAALLAGLAKAPENYSPLNNEDKALSRQQVVLERMADLGYITETEKRTALREPLKWATAPNDPDAKQQDQQKTTAQSF